MNDSLQALADELSAQVLEIVASRQRPRGSTYRLQMNARFTFRDAARIAPYLRDLGITHVYASPYFTAQPGSPHGYDVCRHDQLNPEIGTHDDYGVFVAALREQGLGQVLDVVPNHMAASSHNPWWMDVLENGPSSQFAHFFDIDWQPVKDELANKVLLPILGEQYGQVLESGQLQLDMHEGALILRYFDHVLPIGPKTSLGLFAHRVEELRTQLGEASEAFLEYQSIMTALEHLPPSTATLREKMAERQREKEVIRRRVRRLMDDEPRVAESLRRNIAEFNGQTGDPQSFDRLDELLRAQAYRLCHWRSASDEVNYRRFFDVNGLAALCVESADVFERTHRLVLQLLARGDIDGLRIDHIDGLLDPMRYLWRLQWAYLAELGWQAYAQRLGIEVPTDLDPDRVLAIARQESPVQQAATVPQLPPAEVAGAIGAVVLEERTVLPAPATPPEVSWSELRPVLMRTLCKRLKLPYPDKALLELDASSSFRSTKDSTVPDSSEYDIYEQPATGMAGLPLYVVVEKILGPDEPLPSTWPVAGTSGYDFLQLVNGLLVEPQGLRELVRDYQRFTGEKLEFNEVVYDCKVLILRFSMSSELQMLAHRLSRISEHHRRSRDYTLNMLRHALRETLASFPVYRTYAGPAGVTERDRRFVNLAIARAKRRSPATDAAIFDFLRAILLLEHPQPIDDEARHARELFTGRFQQVTSPVMAKGVEDTAFYSYCPLASVNEVGSHPDSAPVSVENFHQENLARLRTYPLTMLGTSTHDTKRSEDMRARMNVLSEAPHLWRKTCNHWLRLNRRFHQEVDGLPAPSRGDEYLFYQTLVGFWPTTAPSAAEHTELISRLQAYMEKATHEAKVRTSWVNPNAAYDNAMRDFVAQVLEHRKDNRFVAALEQFNDAAIDWGLYSSLSQVALKIMSPGVPDIYQGQELWDFSLVDPDNRRAVDYDLRRSLLHELNAAGPNQVQSPQLAHRLAHSPRDPQLKCLVTSRLLQLRRQLPELFLRGDYVPLNVSGVAARHVCAFVWQLNSAAGNATGSKAQQVVVVAPRFLASLAAGADSATAPQPLWTVETWGDTRVDYEITPGQALRNVFTGAQAAEGPALQLADHFTQFPLLVLSSD